MISLILALLPTTARAFLGDSFFIPPHAGYRKITTRRFDLIYPGHLEPEAARAIQALEAANLKLSKVFSYEPSHHVTVVLTDNEDFANGVTQVLGLTGILLFMTAPDPYSSIGEYDDWIEDLVIHEYTHYLTLEQANGVFSFLRILFGNLVFPNMFWPTWLAEGMAVYAESTFTTGGRGHGTYYNTLTRDGLYRGTLGKRDFLHFDRISGPIPDYPFGEGWYYAGYGIVDEMMARHGDDSPARFATESSWRVPYFLNGGLENISRDATTESFHALWEAWIERERKRMAPELEWLRESGSGDPKFLTPAGVSALGARVSPDGSSVAFIERSGHERPSIQVVDTGTGKIRKLDDAVSGGQLAWSTDGSKLYYAKADYHGPYALYSELYEVSFPGGRVRRITRDGRAKDPGFCQGSGGRGDFLVYSTQRGRISELRAVGVDGNKPRVLYRAPEYHHVSNPRCSPDGKTVYFAEHGTVAYDALESIPATGETNVSPRAIAGGPEAGFSALFPEPFEGGIYFTRARDGYYDLVRWDAAKNKIELVARASGGYWMPSLASDRSKMAVSYVSSTGIRAALLDPLATERAIVSGVAKSPSPAHAEEAHAHAADVLAAQPEAQTLAAQGGRAGYNLLTSLLPRFWAPIVYLGSYQDQIGAEIVGADDTDQLEYTLQAWYDTVPKGPEAILSTLHRISTFRLNLTVASQITQLAAYSDGTRSYQNERKLTVALSRPIPGVFERFTPTAVAELARTHIGGDYGTGDFAPDGRVGVDLSYDNREVYAYSLLPEKGTLVTARERHFFSSPAQAEKGLVSWQQLIPLLPSHSSLSLTGTGAIAPKPSPAIAQSVVRVGGQGTASDLDPALRGYPLGNFVTQQALVLQAAYRVPFAQFFRGFDTFPLFLNNMGAYGFFDGAKLYRASANYRGVIGGAGGGLVLNTTLGYSLPFEIRVEVARGLRPDLNGQTFVTLSWNATTQ